MRGPGFDRPLQVGQLLEIGHQTVDALDPGPLEVAVIGQYAGDRIDVFLLQQQLEFLVAAKRIGRAQQHGEILALCLELVRQRRALVLEPGQFLLPLGQLGIDRAHAAEGRGDGRLGLAQRARGLVLLATGRAQLRGQRADVGTQALEALAGFGFAGGLLRVLGLRLGEQGKQHEQARSHPAHAHQTNSTRLWPLISAGASSPIKASTVGARSRRAPSCRRALRPT